MPPTRSRRGGTFRVIAWSLSALVVSAAVVWWAVNVCIIMRATRYDQADIDRWWRHRNGMRFAVFEAEKMLACWLGIG